MQNPVGGATEVQRVNQQSITIAKVRLCQAPPFLFFFCNDIAAVLILNAYNPGSENVAAASPEGENYFIMLHLAFIKHFTN